MGAASGGRLTFSLVALAVLMASGTAGVVVIGTGPGPAAGGSRATTQMIGSSDQQPDTGQVATSPAGTGPSGAAASAAARGRTVPPAGRPQADSPVGRYNVGAAHSPELLRELAGPLASAGAPSGTAAAGVDVAASQHPGGAAIDWARVAAAGYTFAAVKATEGDYYASPWYARDVAGAEAAGLSVTGYHFAIPNASGGAAQADYAVSHLGSTGGGPARPLELDVEYDPYTATDHTGQCYGLTAAQMVSWIGAFTGEAQRLTGKVPVIYTTVAWWRACTGDSTTFGADPLWVAGSVAGRPAWPAGWRSWSYWQFTSGGTVPGVAAGAATDVSYASARPPAPFSPAAQRATPGPAVPASPPASPSPSSSPSSSPPPSPSPSGLGG